MFYFYQHKFLYHFKGGYAKDMKAVLARGRSHETAGGAWLLLGVVRDGDEAFETMIFERLREWQQVDRGRGNKNTREFELFYPSEQVIDFINGSEFADMGWEPQQDAVAMYPEDQTAKEWLRLVRDHRIGAAHEAAIRALAEEERLRRLTPVHGGWVLWESIGGSGKLFRQTSFKGTGFESDLMLKEGMFVHRLSYQPDNMDVAVVFYFPVFREAFERQNPGQKPPPEAIVGGIEIKKRKVANGRKGTRRRKPEFADPRQMKMPGAAW